MSPSRMRDFFPQKLPFFPVDPQPVNRASFRPAFLAHCFICDGQKKRKKKNILALKVQSEN